MNFRFMIIHTSRKPPSNVKLTVAARILCEAPGDRR